MKKGRHWSVVIPSDFSENFTAAATSIIKNHEELDHSRITLVTSKIRKDDIPKDLKGIHFVRDHVNVFSFAKRVNLGFRETNERDVVVMGDDVEVVTPGAFDILSREAPLRITSPAIRGRVGPSWQKEGNTYPEVPFLSFVCVYIPRMLYSMVGPLDPSFGGYGYEDTDYCIRTRRAGLSCGVTGGVIVEHGVKLHSQFVSVVGPEVLVKLEDNARRNFADKWRKREI